jgi:hypothetical protein
VRTLLEIWKEIVVPYFGYCSGVSFQTAMEVMKVPATISCNVTEIRTRDLQLAVTRAFLPCNVYN